MERQPPIVVVSGPPGSGKTSVSKALAALFPMSLCVPVDDLREWVVGGVAHPVPEWSDETARQFRLAEDAVADLAHRYREAGFAIVIDHCRLPENIDAWIGRSFPGDSVLKVALVPAKGVALLRNRARTDKTFDPAALEPAIRSIAEAYERADLRDWTVSANAGTVEQTAIEIFQAVCDA